MKNSDNDHNKVCHIAEASRLVGDFWNILIIRELLKGCMRFNQLQESVEGITNSTLSERLKRLVDEGIITRKQHNSIPPKVEYSLTEKGKAFRDIVVQIEKFGTDWI